MNQTCSIFWAPTKLELLKAVKI